MTISALIADERVVDVEITADELGVRLMDGRTITIPLAWYPRLLRATESQRTNWQIIGGGYGIHWPDIDEDLSTEGFLRGTPTTRQPARIPRPQRPELRLRGLPAIEADEATEGGELLDLLVDSEDAAEVITSQMNIFSELTNAIAAKLNNHSHTLETISNKQSTKKLGEINKIALLASNDINHYSQWVEKLLPEFETNVEKLNSGFISFYQRLNPKEVEDWEGIRKDREAISNILQTIGPTMQSVRGFRGQVESIKGLSKHLNRAAIRLVKALDGMIANFTDVESFCLRCMQIIDEKMGGAK